MQDDVPNLTPAEFKLFVDCLRRYYASDQYKHSQKFLRDLVHKNLRKQYTTSVLPPKEP